MTQVSGTGFSGTAEDAEDGYAEIGGLGETGVSWRDGVEDGVCGTCASFSVSGGFVEYGVMCSCGDVGGLGVCITCWVGGD